MGRQHRGRCKFGAYTHLKKFNGLNRKEAYVHENVQKVLFPVSRSCHAGSISDTVQPRLSTGIRWGNTPRIISINVSSLPSNYANEATAAMNLWNRVTDPVTKKSRVFMIRTQGTGTGGSSIVMGFLVPGTVGYTEPTYVYNGKYNEMLGAKLTLSSSTSWSIGKKANCHDVKSVVLHELGHVLGVAHCHEKGATSCFSPTCSKNVMQPVIGPNTVRTTLQAYDIGSYQTVYMND